MSAEPEYLNFDLLIQREGAGFEARVTDSPSGEASTSFPAPLGDHEAENLRLRVVRSKGARSIDARSVGVAKDIGEKLFGAVFRDDIRTCFMSSRHIAEHQQKRLRIRLKLVDPASAELPWEYLRDPTSGGTPLGVDRDTPLVRYMELPTKVVRQRVQGPLRILAVISAPSDWEGLDGEREWANLERAISPLRQRGLVTLDRLAPTTFAALERAVAHNSYHIFHFVGHGGFDENSRDGVLIFTNEDGTGSPITSELLGPILGDAPTLQLAVLNACEGAISDGRDIFAGCAQRLVGSGIPAVVAMQAEITDKAAIDFSARFYESVANGLGVDAALTDGRKAIWAQPNKLEWATPVLYMRISDGRIFDIEPPAASMPDAGVVSAPRTIPTSPVASDGGVIAMPPLQPVARVTIATGAPARPMAPWRKALAAVGGAILVLAALCSISRPSTTEPPSTTSQTAAAVVNPAAAVAPVGPTAGEIREPIERLISVYARALRTLDGSGYTCCAAGAYIEELLDELDELYAQGRTVEVKLHDYRYVDAPVQASDGTWIQRTVETWESWTYENGREIEHTEPREVPQIYNIVRLPEGWRVIRHVFE